MAALNKKFARDVGEPAPPQTTARSVNAFGRSFRSPGSDSPAESYPLFQRGDLPAGDRRPVGESGLHSSTHSRDTKDIWKEQQGTPISSRHENCGCASGGGRSGDQKETLRARGTNHFIGSASAGMRGKDGIDEIAQAHSGSPTLEGTDSDRRKGHVSAAEERWEAEDRRRAAEATLPKLDVTRRAFEAQRRHERWTAAPASSQGWDVNTGAASTSDTEELGASLAHRGTERRESRSPGRSPRTGSQRTTSSPSLSSSSSREPFTPPPQPVCSPSEEVGGHRHGRPNAPRCRDGAFETVEEADLAREREGGRIGLGPGPGMQLFSPSSSERGDGGDCDNERASLMGSTSGAKGGEDESATPGVPLRAKLDATDGRSGLDGAAAARPDLGRPHFGELADILPLAGKDSVGGGVSTGRVDGGGGGGGDDFSLARAMAGPVSMYSQALHVALAFVVLMLVAFAKSEDGAVVSGSANSGAGAYGKPSARRRVGGGGKKHRRRSGIGVGIPLVQRWPLLRRLRAIWSKLWHRVEDNLATRWRAAGHALASLRKAWAALWVPRPHAEADVLAEALASSDGDRSLRRATGVSAGGSGSRSTRRSSNGTGGGGSERRRRRGGSKTGRKSARSGPRGGAEEAASDGGSYLRRPVGLNCLSFLSLCGYRHTAGAGGGGGSRSPKFLLVLDLDETLVHCSPCLVEPRRRSLMPDLKLEMRGGAPSDRPACMYAWKRPHLDVFLGVASRWYELALFTSARQCFAEPLVDLIDSQCVIRKRFYRDSCVRRDDGSRAADTGSILASTVREAVGLPPRGGTVDAGVGAGLALGAAAGAAAPGPGSSPDNLKDLQVVGSKHFPLRTVMVDNQPRAVVQQANVLPVRSWFPRDTEDRQLLDLLPVLLALTSCHDVRSILGLRQGAGVSTTAGALAWSTTAA